MTEPTTNRPTYYAPAVMAPPVPRRPYQRICVVCGQDFLALRGYPREFCLPCLQSEARRERCYQADPGGTA